MNATDADLIITGRIATLAGTVGLGWVEAVAVGEGRVLAAGSSVEVESLAGTSTVQWRLRRDQVVMPAITDAHLHLLSAAQSAREVDLSGADGREGVLHRIADAHLRMEEAGDDGWMLGHGWSLDQVDGWPTRAELDRVAPGRPVALASHDHHSRWASTRALSLAGIDHDTPDPDGGTIRRDAAGEPTGVLHEHASKLVLVAVPSRTEADVAAALAAYALGLTALGVVGTQDPGQMNDDPDMRWGPTFYRSLAEAGRLPLRVAASIRPEQLGVAIERGFRSGQGAGHRYRDGWLKLFADGALGSRSAALLEPYESEEWSVAPVGGPRGMFLEEPAALEAIARRAAEAGIAVQIHGIGDAAVRLALDVLSRLPRHPEGVRHRVEHAQLVHPDDIARFGRAGIAASVQPSHLIADEPMIRSAWGSRGAWAFPIRSIDEHGGLLTFGTDAPVAPPDPWPGITIAVARDFHPEQSVGLGSALRAACLGGPLSAGEADRGRLVAGYLADFIVLDAAALDEPIRVGGALESARPLATALGGEVVFRAPGFDP